MSASPPSRFPEPPLPKNTALVSHLVDQVAVAAATSERLSRLVAENNAVVNELSLPSLHRRIVEAVRALVPTTAAALAVLTNEGTVGQVFHLGGIETQAVCVSQESEVLPELTRLVSGLKPGTVERLPGIPAASPTWSGRVAVVAVHYRREVLAVLLLVEDDPGLSSEDEAVLLTLAVAAGTALENARLYEEARLRQDWAQEAAELGSGNRAMGLECEAIRLMTESTFKLADAELVSAWVAGCHPSLLEVDAVFGDGEQEVAHWVLRNDDPLVVRSRQGPLRLAPHELDALGTSSRWAADLVRLGIRTVMVLPVPGGGEPRGLLLVGRHRGRPSFSPLELDLAVDFVERGAMAVDRISAQVVEQRLAVLEDRERIARDLHDHIIQRLFATGLSLQALATTTVPGDRSQRKLCDAVSSIDSAIRQLRTSIFQLTDDDQSGSGLRAAVLEVLQQTTPVLGFEPTLEVVGPVDTLASGELRHHVVAVVREALTNAGKHAQATLLGVTLETDGHIIKVDIIDNGVGLGESMRRSGLANLRQRARRLGGSLLITAPETGGTGLTWTVPLPS